MVAGGVGLAPFVTLAEALRARGTRATLFYGARTRPRLYYVDLFERLGVELVLTTEDGSRGAKGFVTAAARTRARRRGAGQRGVAAVCLRTDADDARRRDAGRAARPAVRSVARTGHGLRPGRLLQLRRADARHGDGRSHHVRSCIDGPVFDARPRRRGRRWRTDYGSFRSHRLADAHQPAHRRQRLLRLRRRVRATWSISSTLGGVAVKGLFLAAREGHPPPRIVETPAGMLNAIGLQGIGVHRFVARAAARAARPPRGGVRQHLRHHARRVRRGGADPLGCRGRRRDRAEHLLPEHQGGRHHVRLQPRPARTTSSAPCAR